MISADFATKIQGLYPSSLFAYYPNYALARYLEPQKGVKADCMEIVRTYIDLILDNIEKEGCVIEYEALKLEIKDKGNTLLQAIAAYGPYQAILDDITAVELLNQGLADFMTQCRIKVNGYEESMDGTYSAVSHIGFWFAYVFGDLCKSNDKCQTKTFFEWFYDIGPHGAHDSYRVSDELLDAIISELPTNEDLLLHIIRMENKESVEAYTNEYDSASIEVLLNNAEQNIRQSDYFPNDMILSNISHILLEKERYKDWTKLLIRLHYPILQQQLIFTLNSPTLCQDLYRTLSSTADYKYKKVDLAYIREQWLRALISMDEYLLEFEKEKDRYQDYSELCAKYDEAISLKDNTLGNDVAVFITTLSVEFCIADIVKWVYNLRRFPQGIESIAIKARNTIVERLRAYVLENLQGGVSDVDDSDLGSILFRLKTLTQQPSPDKDAIKGCLNVFKSHLQKGYLNWSGTCDSVTLDNMRVVVQGICESEIDPRELVKEFLVKYEGYGYNAAGRRYDCVRNEVYVLCILALVLETEDYFPNEESRFDYFQWIINTIIDQCYYADSRNTIETQYQVVLDVLELLVTQVLPVNYKDYYESLLIRTITPLECVIYALRNNRDPKLADANSDMLRARVVIEWPIIKQEWTQKRMLNPINMIEDMLVKLGIR